MIDDYHNLCGRHHDDIEDHHNNCDHNIDGHHNDCDHNIDGHNNDCCHSDEDDYFNVSLYFPNNYLYTVQPALVFLYSSLQASPWQSDLSQTISKSLGGYTNTQATMTLPPLSSANCKYVTS